MASWKEKGVVPDSDSDEEDQGDTQSLSDEAQPRNASHGSVEDQEHRIGLQREGPGNPEQAPDMPASLRCGRPISYSVSLSPRVSKHPPAAISSQELPSLRNLQPEDLSRGDEEICQSYITLSSPLSSLPSSPLQSPVSQGEEVSKRSAPQQIDSQADPFAEEMGMGVNSSGFQPMNRRSLRQRNPIQLHPYALEGEKYRRTLLARGMRPLRLAHTQDATRTQVRLESSPDPDFVSEESQVLGFEDEAPSYYHESVPDVSNNLPIAWNNLDPSSHSDDDEFPELSKLLTLPRGTRNGRGSTSGTTSYGSRLSSRKGSRLVRPTISIGQRHLSAFAEASPFSPPATSSPIPSFNIRGIDRPRGRATSSSLISYNSMPLEDKAFMPDELAGNLPTPATDPAKQIVDLTVDNLDENDPFASDTSSEASTSPSEDAKSVQMRRVAKKIRGVLPASWLRLDQETQNITGHENTSRELRTLSPEKAINLRGVAVRRHASSPKIPRESQLENRIHLQSDDTDGGDDPYITQGLVDETIREQDSDHSFSQFDVGSIMEDDHIDAMLPTKSRQRRLVPDAARRKRRAVSTLLFQRRTEGHGYQPKITSHLTKPRYMELDGHNSKRRRTVTERSEDSNRATDSKILRRNRQVAIPKLSILDVLDRKDVQQRSLPPFLRIAVRNAGRRSSLGRHSPTRKFIKLANKDDTLEAQSVLRKWRGGLIRPQPHAVLRPVSRMPLAKIVNFSQGEAAPDHISSTVMAPAPLAQAEIAQRIAVATPKHSKFASIAANNLPANSQGRKSFLKRGMASKTTMYTARPAQLETSLLEYGNRHPSFAFGSTKKTLDTLYKRTHRGSALRGDVQLARFLGRDSKTQAECVVVPEPGHKKQTVSAGHAEPHQRRPRRKQVPSRIDVNAAVFRQPSEPLILELLQAKPETKGEFSNAGKLAGLSGFSTAYTYHFNIYSLQEGIFFHESTFIGSGRLQKALEIASTPDIAMRQGHLLHRIGDQNLRWGPWNATISSELGLCADWIVEQIEVAGAESSTTVAKDILGCLTFIIDYTQSSLSFPDEIERKHCFCRFTEVLQTLVERLKMFARSQTIEQPIMLQLLIELSTLTVILVFRLLQLCYLDLLEPEISGQLECILQNISAQTVALLLPEGLEAIRKLYDDLQYLSMREGGIKTDRYAAHSWVVLIHVLQAAKVPRLLFWDVVNSVIFAVHNVESNDAKVLERIWYSMFSLFPLFDFDSTGVISSQMRRSTPSTNWAFPQRLLKKIFELYATKSRQSPSFNDYLRALFNRCSHLIQAWGWRKHGQIVGTLFDFFAKHNLAHIRNEEIYESPRFLGELHINPSLEIEPSDRCFHIVLKIIAVSIKQMYASEDMKGIRNIVTRVLPNHDRQYPKEKAIHQRDLASLRNHHDLLCTLFWAAPPDLRPAVGLIRRLIDPASSHREAYLIHLSAWHNLACFLLSSTPTREAYLPLDTWQYDLFSQLILQYQSAKKDVEQQLRQLSSSAKHLVSEETVVHVVENNQNQIMATLEISTLQYVKEISNAPTMAVAKLLFLEQTSPELLLISFTCSIKRQRESASIIASALQLVDAYIRKLNALVPPTAPNPSNGEEDSQDYGSDVWSNLPRLEYIGELNGKIFTGVAELLRTALHADIPCPSLIDSIISTWANIAGALIMTDLHTVSDYVSETGCYYEIGMDDESSHVRMRYGQFLVALVDAMGANFNMQEISRNALSDWLSFLVRPAESFCYEDILFPHFAGLDSILERVAPRFGREGDYDSGRMERAREVMIRAILREMQKELELQPSNKARYQAIIHRILATIKREVRDLDPTTAKAKEYATDVEVILRYLTTYLPDLCPIDEFFKAARLYPTDDEKEIFFPTLRSCALET